MRSVEQSHVEICLNLMCLELGMYMANLTHDLIDHMIMIMIIIF